MRDVLPADMVRSRRVEDAFRDVCLGWGYEEIGTPTIEHLHLFTSVGTLSPSTLQHVYSFLDWDGWSGERVVLRPDSTIPAARLFVEEMRGRQSAKLFYMQNVFRFAPSDEEREAWQCGVELIGPTQPEGDVELILLGGESLRKLGLQYEVKLSDPGLLRAVLTRAGLDSSEQLSLYDRILDGDLNSLDEVQERLPDPNISLRPLLSTEGRGVAYLNNLRAALQPMIPDLERPLNELTIIADVLNRTGIIPIIAPTNVTNFEYYTGPVFRFLVDGREVGGGGRYDGLISLVGGPATPASGFALNVGLIARLLPEAGAPARTAVKIAPASGDAQDLAAAFNLAAALREMGWSTAVAGFEGSPARWMITASAGGYSVRNGSAAPKDFSKPEQVLRSLSENRD